MRLSYSLAVLGMALAECSYAQSHPAATVDTEQIRLGELPTRQLTFTLSDSVAVLKASPAITRPMQCTSDSAVFLDMLQPPTFLQQAVYALTPKSSHSFDVSAIHDLHGVELTSFFPTREHLSLLVRATRETPAIGQGKVRQSSYGFFVARFSPQGVYEKSVELDLHNVLPSQIAELSSGEYLVTGFDRANDVPRLYLISEDGHVVRTLVLPDTMGKFVPSDDANSGKQMIDRSRAVGLIQMTAHGDDIVVWQRNGRGPILTVGAHGSTREVSLNVPRGQSLAEVLPSDKLWLVLLQKFQARPDQEQNLRDMTYYQFDPSSGALSTRLSFRGDSPEHTPAIIACEEQGTFLSYKADDKGQLSILSAR